MTLSKIISLVQRMENEPQYPEYSLVLSTPASPRQLSLHLVSQVHALPTADTYKRKLTVTVDFLWETSLKCDILEMSG